MGVKSCFLLFGEFEWAKIQAGFAGLLKNGDGSSAANQTKRAIPLYPAEQGIQLRFGGQFQGLHKGGSANDTLELYRNPVLVTKLKRADRRERVYIRIVGDGGGPRRGKPGGALD